MHWGGGGGGGGGEGKKQSLHSPKKVSPRTPAWLRRAVRVIWFWSLGWLVALVQRVFFRSKGDDYPDRARQETLSSLKALAEQDKIEEKLSGAHDDVIVVNTSTPPALPTAFPAAGPVAAVARQPPPFLRATKVVQKEEDLQIARKAVERRLKEIGDRRVSNKASASAPDLVPPVTSPPVPVPPSASSTSVVDAAAVVPPSPEISPPETSSVELTVEKGKRLVADSALLETFPEVVSGKTADPFYLVHETGPVDPFAVSAEENRTVLKSLLPSSSSSSSPSLPSMPLLSFGAVERLDWQGSWEKVRSVGRAGFVSYVIMEVFFWALYPLALWTYQQATGMQSLEYLDSQDVTAIVGSGAFFLALARFALPLRFALALAMAPAVEEHLLQPFDELRGLNSETTSKS